MNPPGTRNARKLPVRNRPKTRFGGGINTENSDSIFNDPTRPKSTRPQVFSPMDIDEEPPAGAGNPQTQNLAEHSHAGPGPAHPQETPSQLRSSTTNRLYRIICILLLVYFGSGIVMMPFLRPGMLPEAPKNSANVKQEPFLTKPKVWSTMGMTRAAASARRVPLGIFDDYAALYRTWAQFSASRPTMPRYQDISKDHVHIVPVFNELYSLGDMWNRVTGEFSNTTDADDAILRRAQHWRKRERSVGVVDRSNKTHIDLVHLERYIINSMGDAGTGFVHVTPGFQESETWLSILKDRFRELRESAREDMETEDQKPVGPSDNYDDDGSSSSWVQSPTLPPHAVPLEQLRAVRKICPAGALAPAGNKNDKNYNSRASLLQVLEQLETLQSIVAQASAQQIVAASTHKRWVKFRLLGRISMVWNSESPLAKAVNYAMGVSAVAGERQKVTEMAEKVVGLVSAITPIVRCEAALDKQLRMLLSAPVDRTAQGYEMSPYIWLSNHQGWLTTLPKRPELNMTGSYSAFPQGLDACKSFRKGYSADGQAQEDGDAQDAEMENVMLYVPSAKYIYELFKGDFEWVSALEMLE